MWILIVALVLLTAVAMLVGHVRNKRIEKQIENGEIEEAPQLVEVDQECCGQHEVCEKESLLAGLSKGVEYYNDEELDRYRGCPSDQYTEEAIDEFREVMYTCRESEVAGWCRSLQLRGIELPDELKDEVFLIIGERRLRTAASKSHE